MTEGLDIQLGGVNKIKGTEPMLGGEKKVESLHNLANKISKIREVRDVIVNKESEARRWEHRHGLIGEARKLTRVLEKTLNMRKIGILEQQERGLLQKGSEIISKKPGTYGVSNITYDINYSDPESPHRVEVNYYHIVEGVQFNAQKHMNALTYRQADTDKREIIVDDSGTTRVIVDPDPKWNTIFLRVSESSDEDSRYVTLRWNPQVSPGFHKIEPVLNVQTYNELYSLHSSEIDTRIVG